MSKQKVSRSSKSGEFVTKKFAKKHPSTTQVETVKLPDQNKVLPAAKFFFRIGNRYYKRIKVPTKNGTLEEQSESWRKQTIIDDYGEKILKDIPVIKRKKKKN